MKALRFLGVAILACSMIFVSCKKDKQFTITVNSNNIDWGTVTGGGTYAENASATLTATAKEGYKFVKWQDGNTDNPRTITVTQNATYTATFEESTSPTPPPTPTPEGITITFGDETWTAAQFLVDEDYNAALGLITVYIRKSSEDYPQFMGYLRDCVGTFSNYDLSALMYMNNENDCDDSGNPNWQPDATTTTITAIDFNTKTITAEVSGTLKSLLTGEVRNLHVVFNNAKWTPIDITAKNSPLKKF